jgi:hypothetical protein
MNGFLKQPLGFLFHPHPKDGARAGSGKASTETGDASPTAENAEVAA